GDGVVGRCVRSAAVTTASTPGIALAAVVSMSRNIAWAIVERTNATRAASLSRRSPTYWPPTGRDFGSPVRSARLPSEVMDPPSPPGTLAADRAVSLVDDDQSLLGHLAHRPRWSLAGVARVARAAVGHLVGAPRRHLVHQHAAVVQRAGGAHCLADVAGE